MKLKTFDNISSSVKTRYLVFELGSWKSGDFKNIDSFTVDYLEKDNEKLCEMVLKKEKYIKAGAIVVNVSTISDGTLDLMIEI